MKKLIFTLLLMAGGLGVYAQETGIKFHDIELTEALKQAEKEGKMVFLDAYTSWCAPCKMMASRIFPDRKLGEFMNEHFISVKYDMEKGAGPAMARKYNVTAYPTFLLLNPDGSVQDKIVGASSSAEDFQQLVAKGMKNTASVSNLQKEYKKGDRSKGFMTMYVEALLDTEDYETAEKISRELLNSLPGEEKYFEDLWFIYENPELSPYGSENLTFVVENMGDFVRTVGMDKVEKVLIYSYEVPVEDIVRGKDRESTVEDIERMRESANESGLSDNEYIQTYFDLALAQKNEDTELMLVSAEKLFPQLTDQQLSYIYFAVAQNIKNKADEGQMARLIALSNRLMEKSDYDRFTTSIGQFIQYLER